VQYSIKIQILKLLILLKIIIQKTQIKISKICASIKIMTTMVNNKLFKM